MRDARPRSTIKPLRAHWLMLALFVALQIADIITTNRALTIPGIWEANPLMAWSQAKLGTAWWLPKLAVVAYLCVAAACMRRRWPMVFAVSVSGLAVLANISHFSCPHPLRSGQYPGQEPRFLFQAGE